MCHIASRIAENVAEIRGRIAGAAARVGRAADRVTMVAVTKYVSADVVRPLVAAGCVDLGESRPQQLWDKAAALADLPVRWHMIGHLQRNKIRRTLPLTAMIHSVDSPRLLSAIDEELAGGDQRSRWADRGKGDSPIFANTKIGTAPSRLPVLLEVNISGEAAKHGFAPDAIEPMLAELGAYQGVEVRGLMCMAALEGGPAVARRHFAALRELRDRLQGRYPAGVTLDELSMGMSGDFEAAIEEGATLVRVGSALFEGIGR